MISVAITGYVQSYLQGAPVERDWSASGRQRIVGGRQW